MGPDLPPAPPRSKKMGYYTSLAALKSFGSFESEKDDTLLYAMIGAASEVISNHTRRIFRIDDVSVRTFRRSTRREDAFNGQILHLDEDLAEEASGFNAIDDLPEMLINGGFEIPGAGGADIWAYWTESVGDGALANETSLEYEGADAAKLTSGPSANTLIRQAVTVAPGKTYRVSFRTRGDGTYQGRWLVRDETNYVNIKSPQNTGVPGTTYAMVSDEVVVPDICTSLGLWLYGSTTNGGICYFDSCSVKLADPVYDLETIPPENVIYMPENTPPYYALELTEGTWPDLVEVTGYWGYSRTPPPDIELACLLLAKWMYDLRDTTQGAAVVVTPEGRVLLPQGLPSDVLTILDSPLYKRVSIA